jgi:hypothetical protein
MLQFFFNTWNTHYKFISTKLSSGETTYFPPIGTSLGYILAKQVLFPTPICLRGGKVLQQQLASRQPLRRSDIQFSCVEHHAIPLLPCKNKRPLTAGTKPQAGNESEKTLSILIQLLIPARPIFRPRRLGPNVSTIDTLDGGAHVDTSLM